MFSLVHVADNTGGRAVSLSTIRTLFTKSWTGQRLTELVPNLGIREYVTCGDGRRAAIYSPSAVSTLPLATIFFTPKYLPPSLEGGPVTVI